MNSDISPFASYLYLFQMLSACLTVSAQRYIFIYLFIYLNSFIFEVVCFSSLPKTNLGQEEMLNFAASNLSNRWFDCCDESPFGCVSTLRERNVMQNEYHLIQAFHQAVVAITFARGYCIWVH